MYPENMRKNLGLSLGMWNSQTVLLALIRKGLTREQAYDLVQRNAMKTWETGADFLASLKSDGEVTAKVAPAALEAMFDDAYHLKHVDTIFRRVFGKV